jgi:predicted lipoprotein with Yx(FWY)xxD motif
MVFTERVTLAAGATLLLALSACAQPGDVPASSGDSKVGTVLTDPRGMTLYTNARDGVGRSTCYGVCAALWPPFEPMWPVDVGAETAKPSGPWTLFRRHDGGVQWAYQDRPLYTFVRDKSAGEASGDGVANVWHAAKP